MYLCFIVSQIAVQTSGILLETAITPARNWLAQDEHVSPVARNMKKKDKQCIIFVKMNAINIVSGDKVWLCWAYRVL